MTSVLDRRTSEPYVGGSAGNRYLAVWQFMNTNPRKVKVEAAPVLRPGKEARRVCYLIAHRPPSHQPLGVAWM